jgi:lysophospholipase L1-like esterase
MKHFPVHTALTIAVVVILLAAAHRISHSISDPFLTAVGYLAGYRDPHAQDASADTRQSTAPKVEEPVTLLHDEDGSLEHFYKVLAMTRAGAIARVVHYGDSPTTADLITGDIRRLMQKRFGNAGHGFILLEQPWAWYQHPDVKLLSFGWHPTAATQDRVQDSFYGLGGVSFTGTAPSRTHYSFRMGRHARFDLSFLQQPHGGQLSVSSGGQTLREIDTAADKARPGFATIRADPSVSELDVEVTSGNVRAFGLVAETGGPGVVYDSLGLNGASISVLSRTFSRSHWSEQLRHRNPDLVVINYGTNEADFDDFIRKEYESELREAIRRVRTAVPRSSVLIMSPMDRGYWAAPGRVETMPAIQRIVDIQSRVARETGCGFFNTFAAMGGEGTVARWYREKPPLIAADLIHPHSAGASVIAKALMKELLEGLERFEARERSRESGSSGTLE